MRAAWQTWKQALAFVWRHLLEIIVLNLFWSSLSWLLIPLGPATFALYWFLSELRDDDADMRLVTYYKALPRFFKNGLIWGVGWAVVLLLAYSNGYFWGALLPPVAAWTVRFVWVYAVAFLLAMQPYLLEALVVQGEGWKAALKRSAWQVGANPVYSHLHLLIPILLGVLGYKTITTFPLLLVSLGVAFMAIIAQEVPWKFGEPPPVERRIEDVL